MNSLEQPVVSVACITYNHEKFIRQAIESFLMQEVNFPFEIIIHDDASTDNTPAIIQEYAAKYPSQFVLILQDKNQYSQGKKPFVNFVLPKCRGKYIAVCEGDDFWTDANKLHKQVVFMENHPGCTLCAHNTMVVSRDNDLPQKTFLPKELKAHIQTRQVNIFGLPDLIRFHFFHTSSCLFRNGVITEIPEFYYRLPAGDFGFSFLLALSGEIGYINEVMSVYRENSNGVWNSLSYAGKISHLSKEYQILYENIDSKYQPSIIEAMCKESAETYLDDMYPKGLSIYELEGEANEYVNTILNISTFQKVNPNQLRRKYYSCFYSSLGFRLYKDNKIHAARNSLIKALYYDRSWIRNRGFWKIVLLSILGNKLTNLLRRIM